MRFTSSWSFQVRPQSSSSFSFEEASNADVQPFKLSSQDSDFLQETWAAFLDLSGGLEAAGEEFYRLLFEKEPELKKLRLGAVDRKVDDD